MLSKFKTLPKLAAALAVAAALTFGATQALADIECTPLPPHTCPVPDECEDVCWENGYPYGGECFIGLGCCICFEK